MLKHLGPLVLQLIQDESTQSTNIQRKWLQTNILRLISTLPVLLVSNFIKEIFNHTSTTRAQVNNACCITEFIQHPSKTFDKLTTKEHRRLITSYGTAFCPRVEQLWLRAAEVTRDIKTNRNLIGNYSIQLKMI